MITRSNLAEQLREYQIRSKHDWASVSFFSSTSNLTSSRVDVAIFVIWELVALEPGRYFSIRYAAIAFTNENHKESKIGSEEEAKDASSFINVLCENCLTYITYTIAGKE
ncbi:hypothetical protein ACS0TY_036631 [Phlomoides rotata]